MHVRSNIKKLIAIVVVASAYCSNVSCSQNDWNKKAMEEQRQFAAKQLAMTLRLAQTTKSTVPSNVGFAAGKSGFDAIRAHNLNCDSKKK